MSDVMSMDALKTRFGELSEKGGSASDWIALLEKARKSAPDGLADWVAKAQESLAKCDDTDGGIDLLKWRADNTPADQMSPKDWLRAADVVAGSNPQLLSILTESGFGGRLAARECIRRFRLLHSLVPGALCLHRTWGFGEVKKADFLMKFIEIDFTSRPHHKLAMNVAAESLELLAKDHILARFHDDRAAIRDLAKSAQADLVKAALSSFGPISAAALEDKLVQAGIVLEGEWKDFWKAAKAALKNDESVDIPAKKTEPIRLRDEVSGYDATWYDNLAKQRDIKTILSLVRELLKNIPDVSTLPSASRAILADRLSFVIRAATEKQPAMKMAAILAAERFALEPSECPWSEAAQIFFASPAFLALVHDLSSRDIPAALECFSSMDAQKTRDLCFEHLFSFHFTALGEVMDFLLKDKDAGKIVQEKVLACCRSLRVPIEMLLWILRNDKKCADWNLPKLSILAPVIVSELERDYSGDRLRTRKQLREQLTEKGTLEKVFKSMSPERGKDFFRQMCQSPAWGSDRQLMQRDVLTLFPELQSVIDEEAKAAAPQRLYTSARSYREHEELLKRITDHDIPENSREIEKARAYGDLSENYEYKAAKERQRTLGAQRDKLARELDKIHPTDFVEFSQGVKGTVCLGSSVRIAWPDGHETSYHILGEWDQIPERNFISVNTRVGQLLNGKKVGDIVFMPNDDAPDATCTVKAVEPLSQEILDWAK